LLLVDVSTRSIQTQCLPGPDLRRFVGGAGLAAALLFRRLEPNADPLGAANVLVLAPGALTGSPLPGSDRLALAAKSPLTGLIGESTLSGGVAEALRRAGYAAAVITGAAEAPCCLVIDGDSIELRDVSRLWGCSIPDTVTGLRQEFGEGEFDFLVIGEAGENGVRFASVSSDSGRVAGRTGLGAVMGAKGLKAIAVRGDGEVPPHEPDRLRAYLSAFAERLARPEIGVYGRSGTVGNVFALNYLNALPTANFQQSSFADGHQLLGEALLDRDLVSEGRAAIVR
jgi:aldehyde:ferredoxin oxidoreductase